MMQALARALATVGGLGDRLPAPGTTVGSLVGAVLYWGAAWGLPHPTWAVALGGLVVLLPISVWACGAEAVRREVADPGPVVLDEVAGQWLALAVVSLLRGEPPNLWAVGAAFFLFRAFDVVKPRPISSLERLPGGWGIVADDLAAGLAAGAATFALLAVL
jgi:phosphatidylglycerophosphatase A